MSGRKLPSKRSAPSEPFRHPPPTQGEKDIEAARRRTWKLYYLPPAMPELSNQYTTGCADAYIASRAQDLYTDYAATTASSSSPNCGYP
jgi:hypothetical protein